MDTIASCRVKANRFWKKNPDAKFMISLSDHQVMMMDNRYDNRPNPNMKGMAWLPQDGDEGIGFRFTKRKDDGCSR